MIRGVSTGLDPVVGRDALPLTHRLPFGKPSPSGPWLPQIGMGAWDKMIPKALPRADSGGPCGGRVWGNEAWAENFREPAE